MPNISFLGHLTGLLVGVLHVYGLLHWAIPSNGCCKHLEEMGVCRSLVSLPGFVKVPQEEVRMDGSGWRGLWESAVGAARYGCCGVVRPLVVCALDFVCGLVGRPSWSGRGGGGHMGIE